MPVTMTLMAKRKPPTSEIVTTSLIRFHKKDPMLAKVCEVRVGSGVVEEVER